MNWQHISLLFWRELRDQLRDRRTLFVVLVLPILLYPIMGMGMFQVAQFIREHPSVVTLLGDPSVPGRPGLLEPGLAEEDSHIPVRLAENEAAAKLLDIRRRPPEVPENLGQGRTAQEIALAGLKTGVVDLVVVFPPDFGAAMESQENTASPDTAQAIATKSVGLEIFHNSANQKSKIALVRMSQVLDKWRNELGRENLAERGLPPDLVTPFANKVEDIADEDHRGAALWSRALPMILLLWALTGAFYPAIDLCAGEKERGTLEALLASPAGRTEIVLAKLLTVTVFSLATAALNLAAVAASGVFIVQKLAGTNEAAAAIGTPPLNVIGWMFLAAVPLAALFSALSLGLAAFAKSTKEGQYYLMPLLLIALPLLMLAMSPAAELNLGTSLIPITGMMLLIRALFEGNTQQILVYLAPVLAITTVCCLLAVRWTVDQFRSETVLFREQEKFDLWLWIKHLIRDRRDVPTPALACFAGVFIMILEFVASFVIPAPQGPWGLVGVVLATQVGVIAGPVLLLTLVFTKSPLRALRLRPTSLGAVARAILLAVALHPLTMGLLYLVQWLYPAPEGMLAEMQRQLTANTPFAVLLFAIALTPAICEELAFRGFILTGLQRPGKLWGAILLSSLFFGFAHPVAQQSMVASVVGLVIAFVAVKTRSLFPGMAFHLVHNSLVLIASRLTTEVVANNSLLRLIVVSPEGNQYPYAWYVAAVGGLIALLLWQYFQRLDAKSNRQSHSAAKRIDANHAAGLAQR